MKKILFITLILLGFVPLQAQNTQKMKIRLAEISIVPEYKDIYLQKAKKVGALSVEREAGVICIFPMVMQDNPLQVRIIEIYKDEAAYQQHIQSAHFLEYKNSTLKMVKDLKLIEMDALDPEAMQTIFKKLEN
ncbi:MAG: antibiotic biosynthesis monooxygenase family protein [Capnocytophaga sp.]|nr:antibiotic biosynthesis monooxygenase family protein [Capnocytophaga sp.]